MLTQCRGCAGANGKSGDSATSIQDAPLHWGADKKHGRHGAETVPPDAVLAEIDAQELNRMFVRRRGLPCRACFRVLGCTVFAGVKCRRGAWG